MRLSNFIHFFQRLSLLHLFYFILFHCIIIIIIIIIINIIIIIIIIIINFSPDEIRELKKKSIKFVRDSLKTRGTSFTYILVPFSDPGMLIFDQLPYPTFCSLKVKDSPGQNNHYFKKTFPPTVG